MKRYQHIETKKHEPNRVIDKFLLNLISLCKKHKVTIVPVDGELVVKAYDRKHVKQMTENVKNGFPLPKKKEKLEKEEESDEESEENLESK